MQVTGNSIIKSSNQQTTAVEKILTMPLGELAKLLTAFIDAAATNSSLRVQKVNLPWVYYLKFASCKLKEK